MEFYSAVRQRNKTRLIVIRSQAIVGGDTALCAQLYSWHADAHVGLARKEVENPDMRQFLMRKAEHFLERSKHCELKMLLSLFLSYVLDYFDILTRCLHSDYDRIEDTRGQGDVPSVRTSTA